METTLVLVVVAALGFYALVLMVFAFAMLAFIFFALAVSFGHISLASGALELAKEGQAQALATLGEVLKRVLRR